MEYTSEVTAGIGAIIASGIVNAVKKALFKWLNRRSQRGMNWEDFLLYIYSKKYPKKFNVKVRPDKGENIRR